MHRRDGRAGTARELGIVPNLDGKWRVVDFLYGAQKLAFCPRLRQGRQQSPVRKLADGAEAICRGVAHPDAARHTVIMLQRNDGRVGEANLHRNF